LTLHKILHAFLSAIQERTFFLDCKN